MKRPFTFDRVIRLIIALLFFSGFIWLLDRLSNALLPFAVGLLLAYLMAPAVHWFQFRLRLKSRALSVSVVLLLLLGLFSGITAIFMPIAVNQTTELYQLVREFVSNSHWNTAELPQIVQDRLRELFSNDQVMGLLDPKTLASAGPQVLSKVWGVVAGSYATLTALLGFVVVLLYLVFILMDYEKIMSGWKSWLPNRQSAQIEELAADFARAMGVYFRAQGLIALCNAVLFALGFWIIGLPLGILLGLFVGLLNLVPYLQNVGLIPAAFLALMRSLETGQSFWALMALVLLIFVVVAAVEQAILTPRIMGEATGINPAFMLLSLSVWGSLLGFLGLIIALPLTTVLSSYYRRFLLPEWQNWMNHESEQEVQQELRQPPGMGGEG